MIGTKGAGEKGGMQEKRRGGGSRDVRIENQMGHLGRHPRHLGWWWPRVLTARIEDSNEQGCQGSLQPKVSATQWEGRIWKLLQGAERPAHHLQGLRTTGRQQRQSAVRMAGDAISSGSTDNRSECDTHCPWPQNTDSWLMSLWFEKPIINFINSYQHRVRRFPFPSNRRGSSPQISLCPALYLHKKEGFAQPGWAKSLLLQ